MSTAYRKNIDFYCEMASPQRFEEHWYDHPEFIEILRTGFILCGVLFMAIIFVTACIVLSPEAGIFISICFFLCSNIPHEESDTMQDCDYKVMPI